MVLVSSSSSLFSSSSLRWIQLPVITIALLSSNNNDSSHGSSSSCYYKCSNVVVSASSSSSYSRHPPHRSHSVVTTRPSNNNKNSCNNDNSKECSSYNNNNNNNNNNNSNSGRGKSKLTEFYAYKSFWNSSFISSRQKKDKRTSSATSTSAAKHHHHQEEEMPTSLADTETVDDIEQEERSIRTVSMQRNNHKNRYQSRTDNVQEVEHNTQHREPNPLSLLLDCTIGLAQDEEEDQDDDDYTDDDFYNTDDSYNTNYRDDDRNDYHTTNNHAKISTLVDTGAQATFLSVQAARRIGILHLMDTRYAGYAKGVGGIPTQVLGRIPANTLLLTLGKHGVFQVSPSILILSSTAPEEPSSTDASSTNHYSEDDTTNKYDDTIDLLLGMDLLMEWKAKICLQTMQLILVQPTRSSDPTRENTIIKLPFLNNPQQQQQTSSSSNQYHNKRAKSTFLLRSPPVIPQQQQQQQQYGEDNMSYSQQQVSSPNDSDLESDLDWLDNHNSMTETSSSHSSSYLDRHQDYDSIHENYSYLENDEEEEEESDHSYQLPTVTSIRTSSSTTKEAAQSAIAISTEEEEIDDEDDNYDSDDWNDDDQDLMCDFSGI